MDTPAVPTGAAIWRFRSPGYLLGHTGEAKATEDTAPASVDSAAGRLSSPEVQCSVEYVILHRKAGACPVIAGRSRHCN